MKLNKLRMALASAGMFVASLPLVHAYYQVDFEARAILRAFGELLRLMIGW